MFQYTCRVRRVVDGDTLDVALDLGFGLWYETTIRLVGINAPKLQTPEGQKSKQAAELWLQGQSCVAHTVKDRKEKYGRYLARIFRPDGQVGYQCLNDYLLTNGFAVPYT